MQLIEVKIWRDGKTQLPVPFCESARVEPIVLRRPIIQVSARLRHLKVSLCIYSLKCNSNEWRRYWDS